MQEGWICPKCGKVNAPWKDSCDCKKVETIPVFIPNYPYPIYPDYTPLLPYRNPWDGTIVVTSTGNTTTYEVKSKT